jgi:hypothetical protein
MAVVAAIGVSAVLLRPGSGADGVHIAGSTTAPPPRSTAAKGPGWEQMAFPDGMSCRDVPVAQLPPEPDITILPRAVVETAFTSAVAGVVGKQPAVTMAEWVERSPKQEGPRGYLAVEVPMAGGNGEVQLEVVRYGGTPEEIADASLSVYGNCVPPLRMSLGDGTVLQLYPVNGADTAAPTRPVQIYRPGNRMYIVTAAGYSQDDATPHGGLAGGRGALPLTRQQLAQVAVDLVRGLD